MSEEMKTMEAAAAATVDTKEAEMPVLILPGEEETQLDQMMVEASAQPETVKEVNIEDKIQLTDAEKRQSKILQGRSISATRTISCSMVRMRRQRSRSSPTWRSKRSERRTSALSATPSALWS